MRFKLVTTEEGNPKKMAGAFRCCAIFAILVPATCCLLIVWISSSRLEHIRPPEQAALMGENSGATEAEKETVLSEERQLICFMMVALVLLLFTIASHVFNMVLFYRLRIRKNIDLDDLPSVQRIGFKVLLTAPALCAAIAALILIVGFAVLKRSGNPTAAIVIGYACISSLAVLFSTPWRHGWEACMSREETKDYYQNVELRLDEELHSV